MTKKTIIHVSLFSIWTLGKGKGIPSVYRPIKGLADNGYDNIYITQSSYANPEDDSEPGIKVVKINFPLASYTKSFWSKIFRQLIYFPVIYPLFIYHAIRLAKKKDVAVVYSHTGYVAILGYILSRIFKAKHVVRFYGIGPANKKWAEGLILRQAFWYPADLYIIANDGSNGYEYALKRGVPPHKIAFIRNGIDKVDNLIKDESLYKELAPNNEKLLLSVSRIAYTKNIDKIVEAFFKVSKILPDTRLVIVGDGEERKAMETLGSRLGIAHRISFVGLIDQQDVFRYHSVADIFISMNEISSLSNAVFEAMSCGKCVIALDRGATRELIRDGENGIIIESYEELSDAIIRLLSNSDMISRLGLEAKKTVDACPSWNERVQREVEMINGLCETSSNCNNEKIGE